MGLESERNTSKERPEGEVSGRRSHRVNIVGWRKFLVTLTGLACIMISGYSMEEFAINPVTWSIVATVGAFLTGSIINKKVGGDSYD